MGQSYFAASGGNMNLKQRLWLMAAIGVVLLVIWSTRPVSAASDAKSRVSGAGRTIIEGGTGGTGPMPVLTTVAFHASVSGGDFECLALTPAASSEAGSGSFTVNAMYVTGPITSADINGRTAILHGTATVTGLGAGQNLPFTVKVIEGGPGATIQLQVSGLTFNEILLEGHISIE